MPSTVNKPSHVTKGSVLDDLGLTREEVTEARIKADLWRDLVAHIKGLKLTQKDMAKRLGIYQPEVSSLLNGKLSKFSPGTLIHYAVVLNMGVSVKLTAPKQKRGVVKTLSGAGKTVRHRREQAPRPCPRYGEGSARPEARRQGDDQQREDRLQKRAQPQFRIENDVEQLA